MTLQEKSRLNYLLGRMEGLAEGIPEQAVRMSLISTCEMLTELLEENEEGEE